MREAYDASEGLAVFDPEADIATVEKLKAVGWEGTVSGEQRREQQAPLHPEAFQSSKFQDELLPIPMLMRTKRAKRCRACRHILVKPESKVSSTRYRIRLIASNTLPKVTLKPFSMAGPSAGNPLLALPANGTPQQFLLTLRNPLFERVRITLAAPTVFPVPTLTTKTRPGKYTHRITLLCPSFDIGANTDAWDEALSRDTDVSSSSSRDKRASVALASGGSGGGDGGGAADGGGIGKGGGGGGGSGAKIAEAGKIWEKGRNWTTVVLEVSSSSQQRNQTASPQQQHAAQDKKEGEDECGDENEDEDEDENILEIPVFVRVEWEIEGASTTTTTTTITTTSTSTGGCGGSSSSSNDGAAIAAAASAKGGLSSSGGNNGNKTAKEKRELGYWMVLGVGRMQGN